MPQSHNRGPRRASTILSGRPLSKKLQAVYFIGQVDYLLGFVLGFSAYRHFLADGDLFDDG
jgi:hypothetical protein